MEIALCVLQDLVPFGSASMHQFKYENKDGPGPVMSAIPFAVQISGSLNVYSRAKGIADPY